MCIRDSTDGESSPASIFSQSDYLGGRVYENMYGRRAQLRDRKTGKIYRKMENPLEQVNIFLENLKDVFPQVSLLGFRFCAPRDVRNYLWNCHYMKYMTEDVNAVHSKFKKEKFYEIKNSPYDASMFFLLTLRKLETNLRSWMKKQPPVRSVLHSKK